MNLRELIQENIITAIKNVYELEVENIEVFHPENSAHGDYSTNIALILSKNLKQSPIEIARSLCYELQNLEMSTKINDLDVHIFESIEMAKPGFINLILARQWLKYLLGDVGSFAKYYRDSDKKNILIEYSQPNTNKPMHIGHARNNFLGSSLANVYRYIGYNVMTSNYVGDIGVHICKSMLMYKKYGNEKLPDKKPDHFVGDFYVMFERESENDPSLLEEAQEMLRKWEAGDKEIHELWKKMNTWVYEGWKETYENENVHFDIWEYESAVGEIGKEIVDKAIEQGIAKKQEDGSVLAELEQFGLPNKILLRSDGTSVYATKDLQLAKDGIEKYSLNSRLYVVDYRQADYLSQIFKILELLGYEWASNKLHHVSYGTVELPEGKMSSRKGLVVNADDVFSQLVEIEKDEINQSLKKVTDIDSTARKIALGAFRYGLLKFDPKQNVVFRYEDVSKFEGKTGPYVMYSYARASSVLEKAGFTIEMCDDYDKDSVVLNNRELDILRFIYRFSEVVSDSAAYYSPNLLCNFVFELAQRFNSFYAEVPILNTKNEDEKCFRLHLTYMTSQVIKKALELLGIEVVERM